MRVVTTPTAFPTTPHMAMRALLTCSLSSTLPQEYYEHDGWKLGFRRRAASPGHEAEPPVLLVHPVGIGLDAWFWDKFIDTWEGAELFVPDLIGCGASEAWRPAERGLFLPLDWSRGCEALWRLHIRRPCVVVAQGGHPGAALQEGGDP